MIELYNVALANMYLPGPRLHVVIDHHLPVPAIFKSPNTVVIQYTAFSEASFQIADKVIRDVMASCAVHRHFMQQQADYDKAVLVKFARRPKLQSYGSALWRYYVDKFDKIDKSGLQW